MIKLTDVSKTHDGGRTFAVEKLTLQVNSGELMVLLGSSGSGKSTVLKMINRLIESTSGTIEVDGDNILEQDPVLLRRRIGYVFQDLGLFPHMTVEANIAVVPKMLGWPQRRIDERVEELLDLVGLEPCLYAKRLPAELSGGQQQRVGVARALAADGQYLLMDEPFGALDAITRETLQQEILALKKKLQKTIVFVTHDLFEALLLGDRIAVMHAGKLEQLGTKSELLNCPASRFIADLFAQPARQLALIKGA